MAQQSYSLKYIKIYFWQAISLILNFISMFIVMPYLTKNPAVYGIYTVCISVSIFLSYSDLGFVSAGQKFATEYFSRDKRDDEIRVIGFTGFLLLIFLLVSAGGFFYLSENPQILLKNLATPDKVAIASKLLITLACFAPATLLQRVTQIIFSIRLEDFIIQRILCVVSIFKILSVLYFFGGNRYMIVEYFLFCQAITAVSYIVFIMIAKVRYDYNFGFLLKCFKFDRSVYNIVCKLAYSTLYVTLTWILYYELDSIVIGKFLGVDKVAVYAIGLTMLSFSRSIFGIVFAPFNVRFNYFIGNSDTEGLKQFVAKVIKITFPIVVLPILAQVIVGKALVLSWVGISYTSSIKVTQILVLCNIFAFISYPVGMLLVAQTKIKEMYLINTLIPIIYWAGIAISYNILGLNSFAVFTFVAFSISALYYMRYLLKFLQITLFKFFKEFVWPCAVSVLFLITALIIANNFLPTFKSKLNLLTVTGAMGLSITAALAIQYLFIGDTKTQVKEIFSLLKGDKGR